MYPRTLAIDYGDRRIGLAVSDLLGITAQPIGFITVNGDRDALKQLVGYVNEYQIKKFVLGLPKNMDGSEGESALAAREFGKLLMEKTNLPLDFSDERGTTITAHGYLNNTDTRGKKRKNVVDAVAATIILEDYLRKRKNKNG